MVRLVLLVLLGFYALSSRAQVVLGDTHRNVYDIAVSDSLLGLVSDHTIEIWSTATRKLVKTYTHPGQDIFTSISLDHQHIITGTRAGEVAQWNTSTAERNILQAAGSQGAVTAIDVNQAKALIAVGFANNTMSIYDAVNLKEVATYSTYTKDVTTVKFTKDNTILICGSGDGTVDLYDLQTQTKRTLIEKNKEWVHAIAVSCDSIKLAIATDMDRLLLYTTFDKSKSYRLNAEERTARDWVTSLDYAPDNSQSIASSTLAGKIVIRTGFGVYKKKIKTIVNQIRFMPQVGEYMTLAIATNGKGLLLLDAVNMKYER